MALYNIVAKRAIPRTDLEAHVRYLDPTRKEFKPYYLQSYEADLQGLVANYLEKLKSAFCDAGFDTTLRSSAELSPTNAGRHLAASRDGTQLGFELGADADPWMHYLFSELHAPNKFTEEAGTKSERFRVRRYLFFDEERERTFPIHRIIPSGSLLCISTPFRDDAPFQPFVDVLREQGYAPTIQVLESPPRGSPSSGDSDEKGPRQEEKPVDLTTDPRSPISIYYW